MLKANKDSEAGVPPSKELMAEMGKFNEEMVKAGVMLAGEGLQPSSKGARVRFSGGKLTVTDGPFTETKELIACYALFQVKSMEEAIEWITRFLEVLGKGECEIRPLFEASDFALSFPPEAPRNAEERRGAREAFAARLGLHWRVEDGLIGRHDGFRYPSRHRRGLEDRVGRGSSPASRGSCATSAWPRTSPRMRSSPRSSSGRSRASRTTRAPGSWPPRSIARSTSCAETSGSSASTRRLGRKLEAEQEEAAPDLDAALDDDVGDDLLRLVFTACHPVLSTEARVALTLRLLGGLTTEEIARAFLVPEPTIAQRIVRAKRTLAEERVPFEVPRGAELAERLSSVLEVIYLVFNEGYTATAGDDWMRPALCEDALRLGRILAELTPKEPEVHGLVALMEIQASRSRARVGPSGEPILLLDQNRALWDQLLIRRGLAALERAEKLGGERARTRSRPRSPPVTRERVPRRRRTGRASRRSTRSSPSSRPPPSWS